MRSEMKTASNAVFSIHTLDNALQLQKIFGAHQMTRGRRGRGLIGFILTLRYASIASAQCFEAECDSHLSWVH